jgi:integral membrane protein
MTDANGDSAHLKRYRVMATVVGCMVIVVFTFFFWGEATEPTSWVNRHHTFVLVVDQIHGLLYMVFLVVAAMLARAERWSPGFTITTLLAGTVPILSFWAEHRATKAVRGAGV